MFIEKDDVSLYYEVRGNGDPLILIHGVIVDANLYASAADLLANYYQVITYDRRGNSRSVFKGEPHFSMEGQAQDILSLMEALGIDKAYIVGQSAGAIIG